MQTTQVLPLLKVLICFVSALYFAFMQKMEEIKELLVKHASNEFDWSEISPTIFGAIFESTLNPETRRSGGMHYTSKITLVRGVVAKPATAGNEVNEDAEGYRATEGTTRAKRGERPKV